MNKELASILKNKITGLPFLDVVAGLVQTVEVEDSDGTSKATINRFPVSYDVVGGESCLGREKDLQPNSAKKSITYFEDYGTTPLGLKAGGIIGMASSLRLVCWLNRNRLTGDKYSEISAHCIMQILSRLSFVNPINSGIFQRMVVKPTKIPPQDAQSLFSRYTYDEKVRQFLRPPFEAFGIDLLVTYDVNQRCIEPINFNNELNC